MTEARCICYCLAFSRGQETFKVRGCPKAEGHPGGASPLSPLCVGLSKALTLWTSVLQL